MLLYLAGKPSLKLRALFTLFSNGDSNAFPLNHDRKYFFFSARYALASGIHAMDFKPNDIILFPAYNCGVEIDPIISLSIRLKFYNVKTDLTVDIDDLIDKMSDDVKGVFVTHFLGFPQPMDQIKNICVTKRLFLIEDCAHALLSDYNGTHLGLYGDIAVFSLLKSLPVPNGGILVINNDDITCAQPNVRPNLFSSILYLLELHKLSTAKPRHIFDQLLRSISSRFLSMLGTFLRFFLLGFRKILNPDGLYLVRPDSYHFLPQLSRWQMSRFSEGIMRNSDFDRIKRIRRRNFLHFLDYFAKNNRGVLPITELPANVCPLFFPIILSSSEQRYSIYAALKADGVVTHPWWDRFHPIIEWDDFPDAVYLKQRLLGLPIHQDLELDHLDIIIKQFEYHLLNLANSRCHP